LNLSSVEFLQFLANNGDDDGDDDVFSYLLLKKFRVTKAQKSFPRCQRYAREAV